MRRLPLPGSFVEWAWSSLGVDCFLIFASLQSSLAGQDCRACRMRRGCRRGAAHRRARLLFSCRFGVRASAKADSTGNIPRRNRPRATPARCTASHHIGGDTGPACIPQGVASSRTVQPPGVARYLPCGPGSPGGTPRTSVMVPAVAQAPVVWRTVWAGCRRLHGLLAPRTGGRTDLRHHGLRAGRDWRRRVILSAR